MKKNVVFYLSLMLIFLFSCGSQEESTDENEVEVTVIPFEEGGSETAKDFFEGVLGQLNRVQEKLHLVLDLDLIDVSADSIDTELDSMKTSITIGKKTLKLYATATWKLKEEFESLTMEWYDAIELVARDYLQQLTEPMSRPDNTWTEEERAIYDAYAIAMDDFYKIDSKWISFQSEFATANGFELDGVEL